ncbi:hypothetical protein V3C99_002988, partial [Haemonchus contortus]
DSFYSSATVSMILTAIESRLVKFMLLIEKNAMLAGKHYVWTSFQLFMPIIIGMPLMTVVYMGMEIERNRTETLSLEPTQDFSAPICQNKFFRYVNNVKNRTVLESLIDNSGMQTEEVNSTKELYEQLEAIMTEREMKAKAKEPLSEPEKKTVYGLEFQKMQDKTLQYVVHSSYATEQDILNLKKGLLSDMEILEMKDTRRILKHNDLTLIQCINEFFIRNFVQKEFEGGNRPLFSITSISFKKTSRMPEIFLFQMVVFCQLAVIILAVAFNVAWDSKMKEFLLVINTGRWLILLAALLCNFILAFVSVSTVFVVPLIFSQEMPLGTIYFVLIFLTLGTVILGVLCGTVIPNTVGAIKLAFILWLILVYLAVKSPPVHYSYWLVSIYQLNIVASFKYILEACEHFELRGNPLSLSNMFTYTDIVNPGVSLCFMILDIILYFTFLIMYDSLEWCALFADVFTIVRKKKPEQLKSQSERHSWHQDEEVRPFPADVDAEDLSKVWETSGEVAVYRFEIRAYPEEVSVLLGHSGCGKTTVLKMICGMVRPTEGRVKICDKGIFHKTSFCRSKIGYCPQANILYDSFTAMEHLWFFYSLKRAGKKPGKKVWKSEAITLTDKLGMDDFKDKKAVLLSQGEKRKLCVSIAFIGGSRVVLLDEPTVGMDYTAKKALQDLVQTQKQSRTILLTTQNMEDAESMGHQMYVMFMGRTVCSGDIQFVKGSFMKEYILDVRISQQDATKTIPRIEEGIISMVAGSKVRSKQGNQLKIDLPKLQLQLFPMILTKLEEEKQMGYILDYRITYGNIEETFVRMGEMTEVDKCVASAPLGSRSWNSFRGCLCFWRLIFLLYKKVLFSVLHTPLIISQWLVPIFVALFAAHQIMFESEITNVSVELSLSSIPTGRFLVFNPVNETTVRHMVVQFMSRFDNIEVQHINSSRIDAIWPRKWPWAVGGLYIKKNLQYNTFEYVFLAPRYVSQSELIMMHMANSLLVGKGAAQLNMDFELRPRQHHFDRSTSFIVPITLLLPLILFTSSCTIVPAEEQQSLFKHQQMKTGLWPSMYWLVTLFYDAIIAVFVCLVIKVILLMFHWNAEWGFFGLMCLYCVINLPLAYLIASIISHVGGAFLFLLLFQSLAFIPLFISDMYLQRPGSFVICMHPCMVFLSIVLTEFNKKKFADLTSIDCLIALIINGLVYLIALLIYESPVFPAIRQMIFTRKYEPPAELQFGDDVKEEMDRLTKVNPKGALSVKHLVKYYGKECCLKNITFGVDIGGKFGLVGVTGSGRTTAFNLIAGFQRPSDGSAVHYGENTYSLPRVGWCGSQDALFGRLTCSQNITIIAGLIGYSNIRQVVKTLIEALGLRLHANRKISNCSTGQKRRVSVALALLTRSELITMDEPTRGVDPVTRRDIWRLINSTHFNNRTFFFTSSSIEECEQLSDRYGVLSLGHLIAVGTVDALRAKHTRLCVLQLVVEEYARKKVVDGIREIYANSVPLPVPDSGKGLLKWQIPMQEGDTLSAFYQKLLQVETTLPVTNVFLSQSSYDLALATINEKFAQMAKAKLSTSELEGDK